VNDVDVDIEHIDLDPDDDGDDQPCTTVFVSVLTADGMRYTANSQQDGNLEAPAVVDMIAKTALGAARMHSVTAEVLLSDRLRGRR